jgi:predicted aspartyl protease
MNYPFQRESDSGLIIVSISVDNKFDLKMVLDTGASHTTIDSNALYLSGYDLKDSTGVVDIETANGIIETELFEVKSFKALGIEKRQFSIQVYDFLAHGIYSDYNGLLGLDFLEGKTFCINTLKDVISIKN